MGWDAVNRFDQTSWVDFITPTDYPKPVRNRCVIEVFCGVFVLSLCFLEFSVGVRAFVIGLSQISSFLYARLQTGRIMVWWCPSFRPSVRLSIRPSVRLSVRVSVRSFSALFSYMLWHIELKFCTWLSFTVLQIKFEYRHFPSIFEGVMPLCELRI